MILKILNNKLLVILLFILFGYIVTFSSLFISILGFSVVFVPIFILFISKNKNEEAFLFSSFLVGAEVFIRMIGGFIFYETGKYAVILFMILGILLGEFKQRFSVQFVYYILLLSLGIVFTTVPQGESIKNSIAFNLSGPVGLGVAAFYFYKRPITKQKLFDCLFFMLLPLISMVTFIYFRTPDLNEIVFGSVANFQTSGGFGPNQVSTAIGLGVLIIVVFILGKQKLTGYFAVDAFFLIYFIYRGLLTFSRGGMLTGVLALLTFSLFFIIYKKASFYDMSKYFLIVSLFSVGIWLFTSNITGGMLENRYTGKNSIGVQKKDLSAGRADIFQIQVTNFLENPLGIGVGNGKYQREKEEKKITGASHSEVGRLLEEHGLLGFFILLLLLIVPLFNFVNSNNYQRAFISAFYIMWFLTINHSAMRIALPGFIYALSLIVITDIDE